MGPFILAKVPYNPKCGQWDPRPSTPFYNLIRKFVYMLLILFIVYTVRVYAL